MSHGRTFHQSTVIRGRYHIAISEYVWVESKVCEEYATEFEVTFNGKQISCCFSGVDIV